MKTAVVLSGGGSLGSVQAGMLMALDAAGIVPDLVVGTSAGALNAAYVAGRPWPGATSSLAAVWTGLTRSDVFPLSVGAAARAARGLADHAVPSTGLARLVRRHLPHDLIEDFPIQLAVVATDVMTGQEVVLTHGPAAPAVLASAALPGVFPPVRVDGRLLLDGGLVDHTPLSVAARLGADRVYVLPTGYACALAEPPRSAVGMAMHAFSIAIHRRLTQDIADLQADIDVRVAPPLCPLRVAPTDFSQAGQLISRALASTAAWLADPRPGDQTAHLGLHAHRRTMPTPTRRPTEAPPAHTTLRSAEMTPRTAPADRPHEDPRPRTAAVTSAAVAAAVELVRPRSDDRKAVSWLSAHCAALEHVVYPAARRALPAGPAVVAAAESTTRRLEHELQHLHQKLNGDGRAMRAGVDEIRDAVRHHLDEHLVAHEQLLDDLRAALPAQAWNAMLDRHRAALREGPTRPHPRAPHRGLAERAAFRVAAAADRLMNVLDSQSPPRPPVLCGLPALPSQRPPQAVEGAPGPTAAGA